MTIFTKLGRDIFSPVDASGAQRSVLNGDAQAWSTEVERILATSGFSAADAVGTFSDRSTYDAEAEGFTFVSVDGDGDGVDSTVAFIKESATSGDWSVAIPIQGEKGWSPLFRVANDGARRVMELYDWTGGEGTKSAQTGFVGASGLVADIADGIDIRGPAGPAGEGTGDMLASVYDPSGEGGDAFAGALNVKWRGATGDGTTDDTTAVSAAVAAAYAVGRDLYWPAGTHLTTASIPNFHDVRHFGPGAIQRGSDVFYVDPRDGDANTIYVGGTGGSATNDGLSASEPLNTIQPAFDALANYGPNLGGTWTVQLAAGTYAMTTAGSLDSVTSSNYVYVKGPDVSGGVPTAILDGTGGSAYSHALYFNHPGLRVIVQDVKCIDFNNGGGDSTRGGVVFDKGVDGWVKNLHVTEPSWFGVYGTSALRLLVEGGILDGCRNGVLTDNTRCTVGWNGASNRTVIKNSTESGVYWSRGTQGHIDYTDFEDNAIGCRIAEGSRCDCVGADFKRNTIAVHTETGGFFGRNPADPPEFNTGTADANTVEIRSDAYSGDYNGLLLDARSEARVAYDRTTYPVTGVTGDNKIATIWTAPIGWFREGGQSFRIRVFGTATTISTTTSLFLKIAGVSTSVCGFPSSSISNSAFEFDADVMSNGTGFHRVAQRLAASMVNAQRMTTQALTFNFTSGAEDVELWVNMGASGDSISVNRIEVYATG